MVTCFANQTLLMQCALQEARNCQFPRKTDCVGLRTREIKFGMDGKGVRRENVFIQRPRRTLKYEDVYLRAYADLSTGRAAI